MTRRQKFIQVLYYLYVALCTIVLFSVPARGQSLGGGIFGPYKNWICTNGCTITGSVTATGAIKVADGTAAAPSVAFASDSDGTGTGIFRGAANRIAFSTNGTESWSINASGALVATDNTFDIGNGAADPRDISLTRNIGLRAGALTAGTMTATASSQVRVVVHAFSWTNAMVVALGGVGAGDITVATLPAKTIVKNAYVVINTPDSSANALTVACGRAGATYVDYIAAGDAKAAANTVYGGAAGERGANLTGYDLPSFTATTDVKCHFIKSVTNLSTVTGSTGTVYLETAILP